MEEGNITVLVLGGYGGVGTVFCRYLLEHTNVMVTVAGKRVEKADALARQLAQEFGAHRVSARYVDASESESLRRGFHAVNFVLVAATTTQWARQIVEVAIETGIDYLDVYFQQDIYPQLETLTQRIKQAGCCCITQAGFHPGLPAVFVRKAAQYFDQYDKAMVAFTMDTGFEKAESVYEIIDSVAEYQPQFYQNGKWKTGTYQDAINVDYGKRFGVRNSLPVSMIEIHSLQEVFNLKELGVFTTGFNWFVDYVIFPLILFSQKLRKGLLRSTWAQIFVWGINQFSTANKGVIFLIEAVGKKNGQHRHVSIISEHSNAYDFTVIPVIACLKQYFNGSICTPGLWMMGHIVEPNTLLTDMEKLGVSIQTRVEEENTKDNGVDS